MLADQLLAGWIRYFAEGVVHQGFGRDVTGMEVPGLTGVAQLVAAGRAGGEVVADLALFERVQGSVEQPGKTLGGVRAIEAHAS